MRRNPPRRESFAGVRPPDYSSLLKAQKQTKEALLMEALKEACIVIRSQNSGNCIASVIRALELFAPEWLSKSGWAK